MPIVTQAIPRPDLGVLAYEYAMDAGNQGFIADKVLPFFPTKLKTANFPVIPSSAVIEVVNTQRAPRATYARSDYKFEWDDFNCQENGFEEPLDDGEADLYSIFFDAETVATQRAMIMVLRSREMRAAELVYDTATFPPTAVKKAWNDPASDPYEDVLAGKLAMRQATGLTANALILNYEIFLNLGMSGAVIDRIKYTAPQVQKGEIPAELLAAYFGVDQVIVAGGVYNMGPKGKPVDAADIWSPNFAMLARLSSGTPDLKEAALGRSFLWTSQSNENVTVEYYRQEEIKSNVYRARQYTDEKIQFAGAGYLMEGVTVHS